MLDRLLDLFMSTDSIDTLLAILRRSQLLSPEQLEEVSRELVPHFSDPQALGEYLVEVDWLSAYQLQLLLSGQWDQLTVGPYQILDRLGEGGVSEVFKAWDTLRGRVVALKVLRPDLSAKSDIVRQFQRELHAITRLSHPNIIKTFDAHFDNCLHYFAMEFVEGMDLDRYVSRVGPLSIAQACDYARQAAQGLQHAHQNGLVHRDIKPANLFLLHPPLPPSPAEESTGAVVRKRPPEPVVKILDWGLARCLRDPNSDQEGQDTQANPTGKKPAPSWLEEPEREKGSLVGTVDYLAPEQAREPALVDIRADIYSLGCTLYFLLTAHPPYTAPTLMQKLLQHQEAPIPRIREERGDVPEELEALLLKMLAKAPEERPQIPLLVVTALRRLGTTLSGASGRPGSSWLLPRPTAPGTALNLPRPATHPNLPRPDNSPE